jgi:hypothetical protein
MPSIHIFDCSPADFEQIQKTTRLKPKPNREFKAQTITLELSEYTIEFVLAE